MIILIDIGNTNIYSGIYDENKLVAEFRTHTDLNKSSDEFFNVFKSLLFTHKIDINNIDGGIISSVVPSLTLIVKKAIEDLISKEIKVVGKKLKSGLSIKIDNPSELGSDLVCDCVGGITKYGFPLIIADLGTANKVLVVDNNGNFVGCTISPGIRIGMKSLTSNAAQLMDVSLNAPSKVIGKNSIDSLNSGATYGTSCMLEGLTTKIEKELGYSCRKVLTGGNAILIKEIISEEFVYDQSLILEGLFQIYNKNRQ